MTWISNAVAARRYPVSSNVRSWSAVGETISAMNWRSPSSIDLSQLEYFEVRPIWRQYPSPTYGSDNQRAQSVPVPGRPRYHSAISGYLVDDNLVGNAAQRRLLLNRNDRLPVEQGSHRGRVDHRPGDVDCLRGRKALNPGGDV